MDAQTIAGGVLILVAVTACWRTTCTYLAARWLSVPPPVPQEEGLPPFVVLLPVLREQALVAETLAHFTSLDYPRDRYRTVVVTSERERTEQEEFGRSLASYEDLLWNADPHGAHSRLLTGHLPGPVVADLLSNRAQLSRVEFGDAVTTAHANTRTTGQLVDEVADREPLVRQIEAPSDWALKAGQLRYAIANLDDALSDWPLLADCRYVAVYDFDARPAVNALRAAAHAASGGAAILQQPGFTVPRIPAAATALSQLFPLFDGQMHARWGLRAELANALFDHRLDRLPRPLRALLRSSIHSVGNGLFLDRHQLPALGGIPPVVDDLALGWRAAATGLTVAPVRSPVFYDAYPSLRQAARSRAFICAGYLQATRDTRAAPHRVPGVLPLHMVRIQSRLLQLTYGPYARLALLGLTAVVLPSWTVVVAALTYALYLTDLRVVHALWRRWQPVSRPATTWLLALLLGPVALCWYGAGARAALLRHLRGKADTHHGKTER